MTVKQLKALLKGLPNDMDVVMLTGEDILMSVCMEQSEVIEVEATIDDECEPETRVLLLLVPCSCGVDADVYIEEPNLN